jgi:hypothetical protein
MVATLYAMILPIRAHGDDQRKPVLARFVG